jgi:hypothetical protein
MAETCLSWLGWQRCEDAAARAKGWVEAVESGWLGGVRGTAGGVADGNTIGVNAICGAGADVSVVEAVAVDVNVTGGTDGVRGAQPSERPLVFAAAPERASWRMRPREVRLGTPELAVPLMPQATQA